MMLNDLLDIDWENLSGGSELPIFIVGLTSVDDDLRSKCYERLAGSIYHQGDVARVTAHVVPFLIEILSTGIPDDKYSILDLLETLAAVIDNEQLRKQEIFPPEWERELASMGYGCDPALSRQFELETYQAVAKGIPIYLDLLHDDDLNVRMEAACLLSFFEDSIPTIAPALIRCVDEFESEKKLAAGFVYYLGILLLRSLDTNPQNHIYEDFFQRLIKLHKKDIIGFAAVISILKLNNKKVEQAAIEILLQAVVDPETFSPPAWPRKIICDACDSLCKLNIEVGISLFEQALRHVLSTEDAQFMVNALLGYVLKGNSSAEFDYLIKEVTLPQPEKKASKPDLEHLNDYQRRALEAVLNCEIFWQDPRDILELYGLPNSRSELQINFTHPRGNF